MNLKETIELHSAWLKGLPGGAYANLSGADLRGADLSLADLQLADFRNADLSGADLSGANLGKVKLHLAHLGRANLSGANLTGAKLREADLRGADLSGADLTRVVFVRANLRDANLSGAYLGGADLTGAWLGGADLTGTSLAGAKLGGADLTGANVADADLDYIRDDLWVVLSSAPAEAAALLEALRAGRVDGSVYEDDCGCLVGTTGLPAVVRSGDEMAAYMRDLDRDAERWFSGIKIGDTPDTSELVSITTGWVEDWLGRMRRAFAVAA